MVLVDDRILEYLRAEGPYTPSKLVEAAELPWGVQHVGNRCRELESNGFVRNGGNGVYVITERGEEYLDGEFDASTLD